MLIPNSEFIPSPFSPLVTVSFLSMSVSLFESPFEDIALLQKIGMNNL